MNFAKCQGEQCVGESSARLSHSGIFLQQRVRSQLGIRNLLTGEHCDEPENSVTGIHERVWRAGRNTDDIRGLRGEGPLPADVAGRSLQQNVRLFTSMRMERGTTSRMRFGE